MVQGDEGAESVYLGTPERKGDDQRGAGSTDLAVDNKGSGDGAADHVPAVEPRISPTEARTDV